MIEHADHGSRPGESLGRPGPVLDDLLRAAVAAPSMHNTQPWQWRIGAAGAARAAGAPGTTIDLLTDPARMLPVGDPHGRAAHIACGAALFNLRMAAAAAGLRAHTRLVPDQSDPSFVAVVELANGYQATPSERALHAAIFLRHTNREPYTRRTVPSPVRAELAEAAETEDAILHFLDDDEAMRVQRLAADAERALLSDPAYREELARWVGTDRVADGIPDGSLGPRSAEGRDPVRDLAPHRRRPVRYARFEESPQLAVLSVRAGGAKNWLAAGQALERVWLTATCRGISLCPLTQPLETADAWLVRDPRSGSEEPQMIMRMGYGAPVQTETPRRATTEVVERGIAPNGN